MQIGYTRDHDNPDADTKGDPTSGQMARFFYEYKQKHDMGGLPVVGPDGQPEMAKILCVEVSTAGDKRAKSVMKVTEAHKVMYKRFWDAFNRQEDFTKVVGTPLNLLPKLDLIQQYQIQGMSILSIEQLANVGEGILLQHQWLRHWKNQAQGYLIEHRPKPNQEMLDQLAALTAQVAQLQKQQPAVVEAISVEEKTRREAERAASHADKPDVMKRRTRGPNKPKVQPAADEAHEEKEVAA